MLRIERVDKTAATVVRIESKKYPKGIAVLVSYSTPVAYVDHATGKHYRTAKFHSKTTSSHINRFLAGAEAEEVPQEQLDTLLGE